MELFARFWTVVAGVLMLCVGILLVAVLACGYFDSIEESVVVRVLDLALGLLFAAAFLFLYFGTRPELRAPVARKIWVIAGVIGVVVTGPPLLLHELLIEERTYSGLFYSSRHKSALFTVKGAIRYALEAYAGDCGSFPSQDQGLKALCRNPGLDKWAGPYLDEDCLMDPWHKPYQYSNQDSVVRVWSSGYAKAAVEIPVGK